MPREIDFEPIIKRAFASFYGPEEYKQLLTENFYPVGWSRDGKFAYMVEPPDEECGCYFAEIHIVDLRTDQSLWEYKNDPEKRVAKDGSYLPDDLKRFWKRNQTLFSKKLIAYKIEQSPKFALLLNRFASGGRRYALDLDVRKAPNDSMGIDAVNAATLVLSSPGLGKKTVYSPADKDFREYPPLDMAVVGAFRSPFEDRVAIVLVNVYRGWEGPPHITESKIVGADLKSGFTK